MSDESELVRLSKQINQGYDTPEDRLADRAAELRAQARDDRLARSPSDYAGKWPPTPPGEPRPESGEVQEQDGIVTWAGLRADAIALAERADKGELRSSLADLLRNFE